MTNYSKGANLERKAKAALESAGYSCVRSAGSHGGADVVAWNQTRLRLIQVKNRPLAPAELRRASDELLAMKCPRNGSREIWQRHRKVWLVHVVL